MMRRRKRKARSENKGERRGGQRQIGRITEERGEGGGCYRMMRRRKRKILSEYKGERRKRRQIKASEKKKKREEKDADN